MEFASSMDKNSSQYDLFISRIAKAFAKRHGRHKSKFNQEDLSKLIGLSEEILVHIL
jgi:DNA-binding XRE family transcriptional regulator